MLGLLVLINGFFNQIKSRDCQTTSNQLDQDKNILQSSKATHDNNVVGVVRSTLLKRDNYDKMSDSFDHPSLSTLSSSTTNRVARFQVGLSSGESADSLNNLRDDEPIVKRNSLVDDAGFVDKINSATPEQSSSKRRVVTHRKKRHKNDREKGSDDEDEDSRSRLHVVTPISSRRQSATQLTLPSHAVIKQDRQFRLRTRKPLEVRSPSMLYCSPVRRNSTCNVPENGGLRQTEALRNSLRRRSVDIGKNSGALVENDSLDDSVSGKRVSFYDNSAASVQPSSGTGGLHRTLSTSVLRIKHRRSFWEKVIG